MQLLIQILRGIVIGIANIIPGVSGGTMMVSMGIYDTLIYCITHLFKDFKKSILTLLPYGIGALVGIIGLASLLEFLFEVYPFPTATAFVGLILGGVPPIIKKIDKKKLNITALIIFLFFFTGIVLLSIFGNSNNVVNLTFSLVNVLTMIVVGCIAAATMIIPGVSGSMILMLMGYYEPTLNAVSSFKDALFSFNVAGMLQPLGLLLPFVIGVGIGIFAVAKVIEWLLKRYSTYTYCGVLGLVASSPIAILIGIPFSSVSLTLWIVSILTFAIGFVVAHTLAKEEKA